MFGFVKVFGGMLTNKRSFLYTVFTVENGLLMFIYPRGQGSAQPYVASLLYFPQGARGKFVRSRT